MHLTVHSSAIKIQSKAVALIIALKTKTQGFNIPKEKLI
jgi:hypothetical protein